MDEKNNRQDELDAFWDLSSLVPARRPINRATKSTHTVSVEVDHPSKKTSDIDSATVIKRYIDPLHEENKKIRKEAFEAQETYNLENSLLHSVTLKKKKSVYDLYADFLATAYKISQKGAVPAEYVSFYSYVPQYDQLTDAQLAYYIWWRECFKRGELIKTDVSYILLYVYELINLGGKLNVRDSQKMLAEIWNAYHKEFPAISGKLAIWICDFSLIHHLPPPENLSRSVTKYVNSLKEFFIQLPNGDLEVCAASLLKYGTEYDYRTSKFATGKNVDLFNKHIKGAMITAISFFSGEGRVLSSLAAEDSRLIRNSFEGALCVPTWKYEIEVKYCSFSRSNELRFIMGDIVKYSENKIRAFLGIKSKLSVYSIGTDLQRALDEYFDNAFLTEPTRKVKVEEKHEYDVLYDLPPKPFSMEDAKRIEDRSWETTNDLVSAFETDDAFLSDENPLEQAEDVSQEVQGELGASLGKYLAFVVAVMDDNKESIQRFCLDEGMLPEAIVDIVNEIAVETIGDILIEENDGGFEVIECYAELI